jgi:(p)ppGpp synthase/HD superfamily hydrolase
MPSLAVEWHDAQTRKDIHIPHLSYLTTVSPIVMEYRSNEDKTIATLFYDAIENIPIAMNAAKQEALMESEFGDIVVKIAPGCA